MGCMKLCTKMVLLKGMLNGKRERAGERRAALEQARAGRSLARREGGAVARDKGGEWAAADASRDLLDGSGCTCERE
eukprot:CAMPEP_0185501442 /NCGR_PEP_ID=MMETSP1366-20130426/26323_1 /TAXON_ID=38817 /ORGANISM="Gephyrocapsa oceanica, Strain RCC1303" /LENGTH=76 /DNA_ID=CAMNT_0028110923 /DNA_START=155 /DNA_END=385 /DNA_ORIENTATION=+